MLRYQLNQRATESRNAQTCSCMYVSASEEDKQRAICMYICIYVLHVHVYLSIYPSIYLSICVWCGVVKCGVCVSRGAMQPEEHQSSAPQLRERTRGQAVCYTSEQCVRGVHLALAVSGILALAAGHHSASYRHTSDTGVTLGLSDTEQVFCFASVSNNKQNFPCP
jgi:hypothetical protein